MASNERRHRVWKPEELLRARGMQTVPDREQTFLADISSTFTLDEEQPGVYIRNWSPQPELTTVAPFRFVSKTNSI